MVDFRFSVLVGMYLQFLTCAESLAKRPRTSQLYNILTNAVSKGISMLVVRSFSLFISQNGQYKEVYSRTIEIPQCTRIFKSNCCLKVHNVRLKLALRISGYDCRYSLHCHESLLPRLYPL